MKSILILIFCLTTFQIVLSIFYFKFGWFKWYYHDLLQWHVPNDEQGFDGCSFTSTCKHCGEEIMQDSQGNWF